MPTTTGLATSFINFSRPGASGGGATVTDRDGKIKWAGHNLVVNSESFDNTTSWTRTGVGSVAANSIAAPDGSTTADKLVEDTSNGAHVLTSANIAVVSGATYTISVFCKPAGRDFAMFQFNMGGVNSYAICDLTTATFGTVTNASGSATFSAAAIGNGWVRMTAVATTISAVAGRIEVYAASNATTYSYTGNGTSGIYLWGAHLYRSDLGGMQLNPAQPAGMQSYYPTTPRNLLGFTEDWSNAYWVKSNLKAFGSGSIANAVVAPNGLQTADKIVEDTANGVHSVYTSIALSASTYTYSVYLKAAERSWVYLRAGVGAYFNLATGAKGTVDAGVTADIVSAGDGWYRCWIRVTTTAGTEYPTVFLASANGTNNYAGDGVSGIYLWGAQLSDSASLDTYVPQYGAAVTSAAYYAPRLDFNGATLAARGLLVEEQRTNLIQRSEEFENAYWTRQGVPTITANSVISPSGLQTADTIAGAGTGYCGVYKHATSTNGSTYTSSVYVKANTASFVIILVNNGNVAVWFNLSTGAKGTVVGSAVASDIVPVGNGWYRVYVTAVATGVSHATVWVAPASADNVDNTTGSIYAWGAQVELGAFPTSYVPNVDTVAGVTRAADVASVSTQAFPYSASEGTLVANFSWIGGSASNPFSQTAVSLWQSSGNQIVIYNGDSVATSYCVLGGADQAYLMRSAVSAGVSNKVGFAFKANDFAAVQNGGAAATDTTGTLPSPTTLAIGNSGAPSAYLNGHLRQITYLPRRISNAELQSRSA